MFQSKPKLIKCVSGKQYQAGSRVIIPVEPKYSEIVFNIEKFNNRPKPNRKNIVMFNFLGEFGSNTVASLYCVKHAMQNRYAGKYNIVISWPGLSYLYKHLCDEYWSVDGDMAMVLRDYCRAFHYDSKNLKRLESMLEYHAGNIVDTNEVGKIALTHIYPNYKTIKKDASWPVTPSVEKAELVKQFIKPHSIAINSRNRGCWGRNLSASFYLQLIKELKLMDYNIIWMGEPATSLGVPSDDVIDYRSSELSKDLECTFALTSMLDFTLNFYSASHRISGICAVPHIVTESPSQVLSLTEAGQEGYRMLLADKENKRKVILSHFWDTLENPSKAIDLIKECIEEIKLNNYNTKIGLVDNPDYVKFLMKSNESLLNDKRL